jgi:hypothetical protein
MIITATNVVCGTLSVVFRVLRVVSSVSISIVIGLLALVILLAVVGVYGILAYSATTAAAAMVPGHWLLSWGAAMIIGTAFLYPVYILAHAVNEFDQGPKILD